jgi:hypothetical protein
MKAAELMLFPHGEMPGAPAFDRERRFLPVALPLPCAFFADRDALHRFEPFVASHGAAFHRLPVNEDRVRLAQEPRMVPGTALYRLPPERGSGGR